MLNLQQNRSAYCGCSYRLIVTGIAVLSIWHGTILAETPSDKTEKTAEQAVVDPVIDTIENPPGPIEEIWVTGWRLSTLHKEIIDAEDNAYALFNELNNDDGYDIICKKETRVGSQIIHRVCKGRAYRAAVAEASQDYVDEESTTGTGHFDLDLNERYSNEGLRKRMYALALENPELLEALKRRLAAQRAYDTEREKRQK